MSDRHPDSGLTQEQRDNRDQQSAGYAIKIARSEGEKVGIAVDDRTKVPRMLKRVEDIATSMGVEYTVKKHTSGGVTVTIGEGEVRIIPVLKGKAD